MKVQSHNINNKISNHFIRENAADRIKNENSEKDF